MIEIRKTAILLAALTPLILQAQDVAPSQTLFTNVKIFDGVNVHFVMKDGTVFKNQLD